jgi:hypothetical protein
MLDLRKSLTWSVSVWMVLLMLEQQQLLIRRGVHSDAELVSLVSGFMMITFMLSAPVTDVAGAFYKGGCRDESLKTA